MVNAPANVPHAGTPGHGLKSGAGVVNRHDRVFKRGTLMFIEGETGREMFIMRSGKVRILKQEGDRAVELAALGPGSVLGELSLLDNQPRGATAQVVDEVITTVIDQAVFEDTVSKIPSWLVTVIKTVVSRLRETNKRNGDDIVKNNMAGVINLLLILRNMRLVQIDRNVVVPIERLKEEVYTTTGVSSGDVEKILMTLVLKEMTVIDKDEHGREHIRILNPSALQMYMTYLRVKIRGGKMVGEDLSEAAAEVGRILVNAISVSGRKQPDGRVVIGIPQVELQLQREGKGRFVDPEALDELIALKVVEKVAVSSVVAGTAAKGAVVFDENKLQRVLLLRALIPVFREEVKL